jgi:hypothetical protein
MKSLVDIYIYRVVLFTELKNLNFYATQNTYVKVDIDKLNILLSTYKYKEIDEADEINRKFNKKKRR